MQTKPLGTGEFGATYALSPNEAVKVIRVVNAHFEVDVRAEVQIHKKVQRLRVNGLPCVPTIADGPHIHVLDNKRYITYSMPILQSFHRTIDNWQIIMELNKHLVDKGFLHNDLHQGNVMTMNSNPIIIDLGLMRSYKPPKSAQLRRYIAFAQAAALIDNCNTNTLCPTQNIKGLLHDSIDEVESFFALNHRDSVKVMVRKIESKAGDQTIEVRLQLLLACLSTRFRECDDDEQVWIDERCDLGSPIGDFIYAIRNPKPFKKTLPELYKIAATGGKLGS